SPFAEAAEKRSATIRGAHRDNVGFNAIAKRAPFRDAARRFVAGIISAASRRKCTRAGRRQTRAGRLRRQHAKTMNAGYFGIMAQLPHEICKPGSYLSLMAEIRTVTTLRSKRAEIIAAIANYEKKLSQARADLAHITAAI